MPVKDCVPKSKLGNRPEPAFEKFQTRICHSPVKAALRMEKEMFRFGDPAGELEFDGQAMHVELSEAPTVVEYVPDPQVTQVCAVVALTTLLYLPGAHRVHVDTAVTLLYLPEPHAVHVADPVAFLYVPAAHAVHEPPWGPEKPTLHVHCVNVVLETGEYELPGQPVHVADPVAFLYVPAAHPVHEPPLGPVKPTLQVHCVFAALEAGEYEFPGQSVHVAADPGEYLPSGQSRQEALPKVGLYCPATQALQTCPLGPV